jgi:Fe2+ or Zn2+ uptake regulation protein
MMGNIFLPSQRGVILRGIEQSPGRELSNGLIQRLLKENGHRCSLAEVNEQINWLENRGYVKAVRLGDSAFILIHITRPGIEVAAGLARADGIDPPPEE